MKRDNKGIGVRIEQLGLTFTHVAKQVGITLPSFGRIVKGEKGYGSAKNIEMIHNYLDLCKTVFKKGKDF